MLELGGELIVSRVRHGWVRSRKAHQELDFDTLRDAIAHHIVGGSGRQRYAAGEKKMAAVRAHVQWQT